MILTSLEQDKGFASGDASGDIQLCSRSSSFFLAKGSWFSKTVEVGELLVQLWTVFLSQLFFHTAERLFGERNRDSTAAADSVRANTQAHLLL